MKNAMQVLGGIFAIIAGILVIKVNPAATVFAFAGAVFIFGSIAVGGRK